MPDSIARMPYRNAPYRPVGLDIFDDYYVRYAALFTKCDKLRRVSAVKQNELAFDVRAWNYVNSYCFHSSLTLIVYIFVWLITQSRNYWHRYFRRYAFHSLDDNLLKSVHATPLLPLIGLLKFHK